MKRADLLKRYKWLAKTADRRMLRIEKEYTKEPGLENMGKYAYKRLQKDLRAFATEKQLSKDGPLRADVKAPRTMQGLRAKIKALETFINSETSKKGGIKRTYQKRGDVLNEKYGTDFTWEELADYFNSGLAEKLDNKYGSKTALKIIGEIQRNKETVLKQLGRSKKQTLKLEDKQLEKYVQMTLKDFGVDIKKFLK